MVEKNYLRNKCITMNIVTSPSLQDNLTKTNDPGPTSKDNGVVKSSSMHVASVPRTLITPSCDDVLKRFELCYVKGTLGTLRNTKEKK